MKTSTRKPIETESEILPFTPRNWLASIREIFGDSYIIKLFHIEIRTFQRWTAKRPYVSEESIRENYIEKHDQILKRLMSEGYTDIARAIVAHHGEITGCTINPITEVSPDKTDLCEEMLDDYPAVTKLHAAILNNATIDEVRHLSQMAKQELDETVELYRSKQ